MGDTKPDLYPGSIRGGGKDSDLYAKAKRAMWAEIISGGTGLFLTFFIMMHLTLESSILLGDNVYQIIVDLMEGKLPLAQVLIFVITIAFFIHFIYASRKIPAKLAERRKMKELGLSLKKSSSQWNQPPSEIQLKKHFETGLWLWQVRTGMIVLALGSFHLFLVAWNIFTNMGFADNSGLAAQISKSRVQSGLWLLYLGLGITVVVHMSIGIYRLAVKWVSDSWFDRKKAYLVCRLLLFIFIMLNIAAVLGLAGKLKF
jgi:fumarate reductase subunit C